MEEVIRQRDKREAALWNHPFFEWLHSDQTALEDRFTFCPAGAFMIMQFRDMSRWVLRFPDPRNELEWVINLGTLEDETHSVLFLEQWHKLNMDARLPWGTSDVLWWLYLSPDQEPYRRFGIEFIRMAIDDEDDPVLRFGHSEPGEATGHVMLSNSAKVAAQLLAETGVDHRYFGSHHLGLETGHVGNTVGVFEPLVIDAELRAKALVLCDRMFDLFEEVFDGFLRYAQAYVNSATTPVRPANLAAQSDWSAPKLAVAPRDSHDAELAQYLASRRATLRAHPFFEWLRTAELTPAERLQRFIPMWVGDILGYRDLNKYAMTYLEPASSAEHAVNAWAAQLARHSALFLSDWETLELDHLLDYTAGEALEWLFLDHDMDLHRENMIEFTKLALRHRDPVLRWWMLVALESTGEEFFEQTRPLALEVEAATGRRLDYLAGRHDAPETPNAGGGTPPAALTALQLRDAKDIIGHVFDAMERQLTRSGAIAKAGKYAVADLRTAGQGIPNWPFPAEAAS